MMNEIVKQKKNIRKILTEKRNLIKRNTTLEFNVDAFNKLTEKIEFNSVNCVGSFMSIRSEISTNQLNLSILEMKKKLAFPTIEKNSETLIFKTTNSDNSFKLGKFNIPEPINDTTEIIPKLFFVPCLGFDVKGYRIGYGGGFYDKTLDQLSNNQKPQLILLAYDFQKVKSCFPENHDIKAHACLTPNKFLKFKE